MGKSNGIKNSKKIFVQTNSSPSSKKWEVRQSENVKASKTFDTKEEAIEYGRKLANSHNAELKIKNVDGKISKGHSGSDTGGHKNDPKKIKG